MYYEIKKPKKIRIYVSNCIKSAAQIKAETGCDVIINGGFYQTPTKPVCPLKVDGRVLSYSSDTYTGYAFNAESGKLHVITNKEYKNYQNFIGAIWAITDGQLQTMYYNPDVAGIRGRTAFGLKADGSVLLFCSADGTSEACSPEDAARKLIAKGCQTGMVLDGGGSSQIICPTGYIRSSRKVHNYICFWEGDPDDVYPEDEPNVEDEIIETNLTWNGSLSYRSVTTHLILHHAAGTGSVETVHKAHLANGWRGIAYHYYVRKDGSIYRGRPERAIGGHTTNWNYCSIGICAEGDFSKESMSDAQKKSLQRLVANIVSRYPKLKVGAHRDFALTACPGKLYPYDEIVSGTTTTNTTTSKDQPSGNNAIELFQKWLNTSYKGGLVADGVFGAKTKTAALRAFQTYLNTVYKAGLVVDGVWGAKSAAASASCILKTNSRNDAVYILQGMLYGAGYEPNGLDGIFGSGCCNTVKRYQAAKNLTADGVVGQKTWAAIFN